jgi:hypothetical protein
MQIKFFFTPVSKATFFAVSNEIAFSKSIINTVYFRHDIQLLPATCPIKLKLALVAIEFQGAVIPTYYFYYELCEILLSL